MGRSRHNIQGPKLRLIRDKQQCSNCETLQACLNTWLDKDVVDEISGIRFFRGSCKPGQAIYKMEDQFQSLFIIQSGSVKLEKPLEDGHLHVKGFYFPGDVIGLESAGSSSYEYDAIALQTTRVCQLPYNRFKSLSMRVQKAFISMLEAEIRESNKLLVEERFLSSDKRVLLFLCSLYQRNNTRYLGSKIKLQLPMTKVDLGNYLGIRPESVSRSLTRLQSQGIIRNHLKHIEIIDTDSARHAICNVSM